MRQLLIARRGICALLVVSMVCAVCDAKHSIKLTYPVTIVTALYDLGRGHHGRSMNDYLKWFNITLALKTPMVVHVPASTTGFVKARRQGCLTEIIVEELHETPYFRYAGLVEHLVSNATFKSKMQSPERVEFALPMYLPIQFSKFRWLHDASTRNTFHSRYFFWMDAGFGRWTAPYAGRLWPDAALLQQLESEVVVVQAMGGVDLAPLKPEQEEAYLWMHTSKICGCCFGASAPAIGRLQMDMDYFFTQDMLARSVVNTEQHAFFVLHSRNTSRFKINPCCKIGKDPMDDFLQALA